MSEDADTTPATDAEPRFGAARIAVLVVLGLIAAWFVYDGIGSLVNLPQLFTELGLEAEIPWVALWLGAVQAPVIFAAAALIGAHQPVARYALVLIAALAVIAAARLSLIAAATGVITVLPA